MFNTKNLLNFSIDKELRKVGLTASSFKCIHFSKNVKNEFDPRHAYDSTNPH